MPEEPSLAPAPGTLWRVHKQAYGALNPPARDGDPDESWSRFDIAGFATLYGGVNELTAYEESLAYARVDPEEYEGLFDDEDVEPVSEQWARLGHMSEQHMPAQWRAVRSLSSFVPKRAEDLTIINVGSGDTLAYLRATMGQWAVRLEPFPPTDLDVSGVTGSDRRLTCAVAWWLQRHTLPDGRRPDGLRYNSRHGTDMECYALWVDLGNYPTGTPIADAVESVYECTETRAIECHDHEFKRAARRLRLVVH